MTADDTDATRRLIGRADPAASLAPVGADRLTRLAEEAMTTETTRCACTFWLSARGASGRATVMKYGSSGPSDTARSPAGAGSPPSHLARNPAL